MRQGRNSCPCPYFPTRFTNNRRSYFSPATSTLWAKKSTLEPQMILLPHTILKPWSALLPQPILDPHTILLPETPLKPQTILEPHTMLLPHTMLVPVIRATELVEAV